MLEAPVGPNDVERLKALLELDVFDALPESIFDEIVQVASNICQTPIAYVSIIDKDKQWLKSKVGMEISEFPRNNSICGHTINNEHVFIVNDTTKDDRFKDNPLVTGKPKIVFYAGVQLTSPSGFHIGTLCVIDHKPRELTQDQISCLHTFAKLVVTYLVMNQQNKIIRLLNTEIQKAAVKISASSEQLIQTTKLASLVEMAAGIAHEINNPLAIIQGKAQLVLSMIENKNIDTEKSKLYLNSILSTINRVSRIISGLKSFARNSEQDPFYRADLNQIAQESIEILEKKIQENEITIEFICPKNIHFDCRASQIGQCLVNLISNSIDAIEHCPDKWIKIEVKEIDNWVEIQFTDSGKGIRDPNIRARLMQPFFTTKETGKGIGLGLSVTKGIIDSHKGHFLYNEKSQNTQFIIQLPVHQVSSSIVAVED